MAKKKTKKIILRDCTQCISAKAHNNKTYCTLRLKDANIYTESGIVSQQECGYYKSKTTQQMIKEVS